MYNVYGWKLIYAPRANTFDVAQGPVHDRNLNKASPNCRNNLARECDTGWDLHIMRNLVGNVKS